MPITRRRRAAIATAVTTGLAATLLSVPAVASATTHTAPSPQSATIESTVSCMRNGFTGTAHVRTTHDPSSGTVTFAVTSVKIDPAPGGEGRGEANLMGHTSELSLVPGVPELHGQWGDLSESLMQDGKEHVVDLRMTRAANEGRAYAATLGFTFDADGGDPHCQTEATSPLVLQPPAPSPGTSCALEFWQGAQACWRADEDRIATIEVTSWNSDMPEYLVLNADYSVDHRGRFTDGTYSRVFLLEGQSLALTSPVDPSSPNAIQLRSVRPLADGLQPEAGEQCYASNPGDTPCFVVAPRNYRLQIDVVSTPRGNAPEYYVTDASTGERKHGGRLEMGLNQDGSPRTSTIWVDAGDQFWLTPPAASWEKNVIRLTDVRTY